MHSCFLFNLFIPILFTLKETACKSKIETIFNNVLNNIEEQHKKVSQLVNATIKMKAKSEFFKEMNRSLSLMTDEYK